MAQTYATDEGGNVAPLLATNPEWVAYLNSLGLQQNQFAADIERQRGLARSNAAFQTAGLEAPGQAQRRNITAVNEGRGMARSGQQLRQIATQRAGQNQQAAGIQNSLTGTLSNLESQVAAKNVANNVSRMTQEASLRAQGFV